MQAEVHLLHQSDFYQIRDYQCTCMECSLSKVEQCEQFSICFARSGFYEQQVFRKAQEMHIGRLLISKPGIEYVIRHIDNHPDLCTSFNFSAAFYEKVKEHFREEAKWFFSNADVQSLLLTAHADIEFIHQRILSQAKQPSSLEMDDLVVQLVEKVMLTLGNKKTVEHVSASLKRHHLSTIERARDFLFQNFSQHIGLQQLAEHCCVSVFHFGRIFKSMMNTSPHQYLTELRLNNAKLLLQSTQRSVTEIAFQCGFNSLEHFTAAYRNQFKTTPLTSRKENKDFLRLREWQ